MKKVNALVFLIALSSSIFLSALYPSFRDRLSWHLQYQLCQAAANGETTRLRILIFMGANPRGWNTTYEPILFAARQGQSKAIQVLLENGVDINSIGLFHQTPLMEAIWERHVETAEFLLLRGANLYLTDNHDGTALWQAARSNQVEMVRLLMNHGGRQCKDAESALSAAVERDQTELVRELLVGGVDSRDVTATPSILPLSVVAASNGNQEMMKLLKAREPAK